MRAAAFERRGKQALWMPANRDHETFVDEPTEATYAEAEQLARALTLAGCDDSKCELEYRLSRVDRHGGMDVTDDFACWATEHELDDEASVVDTFRLTAPAAAVRAHAHRGWLRGRFARAALPASDS